MAKRSHKVANSMEVAVAETTPEVEEEAKAKVVAVARRVNRSNRANQVISSSSNTSLNMVKVNSRGKDKERGSTSKNNNNNNSNRPRRNHRRHRPAALNSMVIFSRRCSSSNRWHNLLRHRLRLRVSLRNKPRANSRREVVAVESINKNNSKSNRSSKSWRNNWPHSDPSNRRRLPTPARPQAPRARFRPPTVRSSASRRICPA